MSTIHSMLPARNVRGRISLADKVLPNGVSVMPHNPHVVRSIPCTVSRMDTPNRVACEACRRANVMGDCESESHGLEETSNSCSGTFGSGCRKNRFARPKNEHMKYLDLLEEVSRKATEARVRVEQLRKQKGFVERRRAVGVERARQNLQ
ncbi:hypothetical protein K469DRAFT_702176 [Zopfia rhizophila CBS 207.26]|uniref:Uncharacterized protein n=1 Tax=Zopfia rhizophila CBS 207.26 TaxID=1314779 RepID=A0A6A6DB10_9PEZI|nr:hypothetical protein K469DRAFT_702176 [Zopfia rhizophila CBS 207.26]